MTAEEDERFVEKFDATGEGRHVANPDVVHRRAGGEGKCASEHAACEGHAATEVEIAHQQVVPPTFVQLHVREEGGGGDVQRLIGDAAVAHHAICSAFQRCKHALHFALEPNVVLVGEKNVLAPCLSERMFEIVDG